MIYELTVLATCPKSEHLNSTPSHNISPGRSHSM